MNEKFLERKSFHTHTFLTFVYEYEFLQQSSLFILFLFVISYTDLSPIKISRSNI